METGLKISIQKYLKKAGAWELKTWGGSMQRKGIPDILVCYRGRFIAFEVKMPGEKPTKLQEYELSQIKKAGGIAEVVYSLKEVKETIDGIKEE